MRSNRSGFTLIELIVVLIIIGILASLAAPMMQGFKVKAICAEAVAGMGTIRNAIRQYYVEFNRFPNEWAASLPIGDPSVEKYFISAGLNADQMNGTYFDKWNYYLYIYNDGNYKYSEIVARPRGHEIYGYTPIAPKHNETKDIVDNNNDWGQMFMHVENGHIWQNDLSRSGYPNS